MNFQNLPRRWGRAKRKRERVKLATAYWREEFRKTLHAAIDRIWEDAMKPMDWADLGFKVTEGPTDADAIIGLP